MKKNIKYNNRLSIAQNAKNNGVSVASLRHFIQTEFIDRRYDRKIAIIEEAKAYYIQHPKATKAEIAKHTHHSLTTIKKYWQYISTEQELTDFNKNKVKKCQQRQVNNFYATHPSVTNDLLRVETFCHEVLEPFCGSGTMANVLIENGYDVHAYDIIDRNFGKIADFLSTDFEIGRFDVVTNPPYNADFINYVEKCLNICKNKVAMLLPIRYLSSESRYNALYSKFPPSRIYVYQNRICIAKNADFKKYADRGANLEIYGWFLWDRTYSGETILRWLKNED